MNFNSNNYIVFCRHISGIGAKMAKKIVERRLADGPFICRSQLLCIAGLGSKTFEQSAGFLRIMPRSNIDDTERFVSHCLSYHILLSSLSSSSSLSLSVALTPPGNGVLVVTIDITTPPKWFRLCKFACDFHKKFTLAIPCRSNPCAADHSASALMRISLVLTTQQLFNVPLPRHKSEWAGQGLLRSGGGVIGPGAVSSTLRNVNPIYHSHLIVLKFLTTNDSLLSEAQAS